MRRSESQSNEKIKSVPGFIDHKVWLFFIFDGNSLRGLGR